MPSISSKGFEPLLPVLNHRPPTLRLLSLLEKNHKEHDIFFHKDLHNHLPHVLFSRHDLGADDGRLDKEYKDEDGDLEPKKEAVKGVTINDENWTKYLGDHSYYSNYLQFFDQTLTQSSDPIETSLRYALHPSLLPHLVDGAVHPLIHLGFGVEFNHVGVMSEGLSEACLQQGVVKSVLPNEDGLHNDLTTSSLEELLKWVKEDKELDGVVRHEENNKTKSTLEKCSGRIRHWASCYKIDESPMSLRAAFTSIYTMTVRLLVLTGFPPATGNTGSDLKLDFFLLHTLTSAFSLRHLIPHIPPSNLPNVFRSFVAIVLLHYVARGRPTIHEWKDLDGYISRAGGGGLDWETVVSGAIEEPDLHVPKSVRAIKYAALNPKEFFWDAGLVDGEELQQYIKGAKIIVDHFRKGGDWYFDGVGYSEAWKDGK